MAGNLALSVSNTTPTGTGIPPDTGIRLQGLDSEERQAHTWTDQIKSEVSKVLWVYSKISNYEDLLKAQYKVKCLFSP